jgi:hypothetical protein
VEGNKKKGDWGWGLFSTYTDFEKMIYESYQGLLAASHDKNSHSSVSFQEQASRVDLLSKRPHGVASRPSRFLCHTLPILRYGFFDQPKLLSNRVWCAAQETIMPLEDGECLVTRNFLSADIGNKTGNKFSENAAYNQLEKEILTPPL